MAHKSLAGSTYKVSPGNAFGRIGTAFGEGLAQNIPKELEYQRKKLGLEELSNAPSNLTPEQYLAKAAGTYGITPQEIQSFGELAKLRRARGSFGANGNPSRDQNSQQPQTESKKLDEVEFANLGRKALQQQSKKGNERDEIPQGNFPSGQPQIVEKNPLSPELQPAIPWTKEKRDAEIEREWNQHPELTFPEITARVADNERRYLESPAAYREEQNYLEEVQNKVNAEIDQQLRKKLQIPKDQEIFAAPEGQKPKISGESINRIERGVSKDLKKNPDSNVKDLVNKWTDLALDNDKDQKNFETLANRPFDEKINPEYKKQTVEKLKSMSKTFHNFGNSEELYNNLGSSFGLSPEGRASIAYPLSSQAQKYIGSIKRPTLYEQAFKKRDNSEKYANDLEDYLTREDSILSIAKSLKERDPFFDEKKFLREVRNNQDELGLTPTQKRQIEERGDFDFFPNWGDLFLFPGIFGRSK